MDCNDINKGMKVKTTKLGKTIGLCIMEKHLSVREAGITGTVLNPVPGHGGDVWFVQHDNSEVVGAYIINEFEPAA